MKNIFLSALLLASLSLQAQDLPKLQTNKQGQTQLLVDGKPYLMLGGELHNSSTGSLQYMAPIWPRMAKQNLNTVIAPVTWELLEPEEGKFDFTQVDAMIQGCQQNHLKLVILWFGSWKNGKSMYTPAWVKKDTKRFPLALNSDGSKNDALSTLGVESRKADVKAYSALMQHIKETDTQHTVIFMQLENEIGTLDMMASYMGGANKAMRDFSPAANKAFQGQVPTALISYLKAHKKTLRPAVADAWKAQGNKEKGTWEEVFGKGQPAKDIKDSQDPDAWGKDYPYLTEEIFNAWNYATYVEEIARAGKAIYPIPVYVNSWIKQKKSREPGLYPSGGPQPHIFDIWKAAAPSVDLLGPDIYATDIFDFTVSGFQAPGNPVLMPETEVTPTGAARAFYALGKYNMLCYSPFGIDGGGLMLSANPNDNSYQQAYGVLKHLIPQILANQGTGKMTGLFQQGSQPATTQLGKYTLMLFNINLAMSQALVGATVQGEAVQTPPATGALIIQTGEDEFIVAGGIGGDVLSFSLTDKSKSQSGILSVDEITWDEQGNEIAHRLNGDETAYGTCVFRTGKASCFRVKMYEY